MIRRVVSLAWLMSVLAFVGCDKQPKPTPSKPGADSQRPPLRVLVVGDVDIGPTLIQRWKGASQQALEVTTISESEWLSKDTCRTDIVVFPARDLAEAAERKWLSPLPSQLEAEHVSKNRDSDSEAAWPSVWKAQVTYGKQVWGVPLGSSMLWVATNATSSIESWTVDQLLALPTENAQVDKAEKTIESSPENATHSAMVDRYVMLLLARGSLSMSSGIFFQPSNLRPKLTDPLHVRVAQELAVYVGKQGRAWGQSHEAMWEQLANGRQVWGFAMPGDWMHRELSNSSDVRVARLRSDVSGDGDSGMLIDTGEGWIACQAQATRQSSVASYFLEWIDQEDQREALHRVTSHVWPRKSGLGKLAALRPELASYYRQSATALGRMDVVTELRIRGGNRYRIKLAESLSRIVQTPDQAASILQQCSQDWEAITEELGRDGQRISFERCLQLSGMSGT